MNKKNEFSTKDLHEAAYLYATGYKLLRLDKEKTYYWLVFEDTEACNRAIEKFWRKEGLIDAKTYADAIRSLKDRLFSLKRVL